MKAKFFTLAAMAALVGFTACNKDNGGNEDAGNGKSTLMVRLPAKVTRSVETPVAGGATVFSDLNDVTIFLLNNDAVIGDPIDFVEDGTWSGGGSYMRIENVDAKVNRVLVLANMPTDLTTAQQTAFEALTSASAIKYFAFSIASQNPGSDDGIASQTMIGIAAATATTDPDSGHDATHSYKQADVTLDALTARFEIGAVKPGTGVKSVELIGVWINNYYANNAKVSSEIVLNASTSTYWALSATPGMATTAFGSVSVTNPYLPTQYYDAYSTDVKLDTDSKVYAYQVFAGDNIPHVIMLVKGEYLTEQTEGEGDKFFLGYLTFNKFYEGTSTTLIDEIEPNYIYKIGVGATGVTVNGGDITDKPELDNFDLGIKVVRTPWTEKTVTPGV